MSKDNYSEVLSKLFDEKIVSVLSVLLRKTGEFGIREISREANVSTATTYRIIQKLTELGVINKIKRGKNSVYEVLPKSERFEQVYGLIVGPRPNPIDMLRYELDRLVGASNHRLLVRGTGSAEKIFVVCDKANDVNYEKLSKIIKENTGQKLAFAIISPSQLAQMQEMGLL